MRGIIWHIDIYLSVTFLFFIWSVGCLCKPISHYNGLTGWNFDMLHQQIHVYPSKMVPALACLSSSTGQWSDNFGATFQVLTSETATAYEHAWSVASIVVELVGGQFMLDERLRFPTGRRCLGETTSDATGETQDWRQYVFGYGYGYGYGYGCRGCTAFFTMSQTWSYATALNLSHRLAMVSK